MLRLGFKSWLGSWQEWGIIILLFLALEIAVASIEQAQWITPHPSLTLVLVLAVLTGWLLCKSRLPAIVLHPLAVALGAVVTVWQASNLFPSPEITSRINQLEVALQSWWLAVNTGKPSEGTLQVAVLLIFFTWIMGYISTWFAIRRQNAWVVVSLSAITILINLGNLPEQQYTFFFFYLLIALLLVGMTNLAKRYFQLKKQGASYPNLGVISLMVSLVCLTVLVVSTAWLTPKVRVESLETMTGTKMLWTNSIEKHFDNFLASVPAKLPFLRSDGKKALLFGDSSFDRGNQLELVVVSEQPLYWRTRMYDSYSSFGWTSSNATEHLLRQGSHSAEDEEISKRNEITYTVIPKVKTDILPAGGEFVSSSIPVSMRMLAPLSFSVENGPKSESTQTDAQLSAVDPTRTQPAGNDIVAVSSLYPLLPDRRYKVTTSISSAKPEDLSQAYTPWVSDYYLQLPPTLPERVGQLSETVTEEAETPYDKVLAIERYLTQINYRVEVNAPPPGVDGVDYFLFTQKSGNCVQFASAMAVMLRSVGIPSRVVIGYAPGEWDAKTGISNLTSNERHAWPEVYFSGYGWVGFEPTPGANNEQETAGAGGNLSSEFEDEFLEEAIGGSNIGIGGPGQTSNKGLDLAQLLANGAIILVMLILAIGIVISLVLGAWLFLPRRRGHIMRPDYSSEIYRKMCFLASLVKLSPRPQQTPLEYYARLASVFPLQAESVGTIVQAYVERQYSSRKESGHRERWRLQQSWREVRQRLIRQMFHIRH